MNISINNTVQELRDLYERLTNEQDKAIINNTVLLIQELGCNESFFASRLDECYEHLLAHRKLINHLRGISNIVSESNCNLPICEDICFEIQQKPKHNTVQNNKDDWE